MTRDNSGASQTLLTKSEFLSFRECGKSAWLRRNRPGAVDWPPPSEFDRLLMREDYRVEAIARRMLVDGPGGELFDFQVEFIEGTCLARADAVKRFPDGSIEIFEVKSSTSPAEHIVDACFQRIIAERAGFSVRAVHIIHVNPDYRRKGDVDASALLIIESVDDAIAAIREEIENSLDTALEYLGLDTIDESGCECIRKSRAQWCAAFTHFNRNLPDPSVHVLPRMTGNRLFRLMDEGRLSIHDLDDTDVTPSQLPVLAALKTGQPQIDRERLKMFVSGLAYPLYMYDYETAAGAVPMADGHGPHEQIPVQWSCHVVDEQGEYDHSEFLAKRHGQEGELVASLRNAIGDTGNLMVWNASFEKACNRRLARLLPQYAEYLEDLNDRTVDLMDVFKAHYVHPDFCGSVSIKRVLPVLCPELAYSETEVHDGTGAILAFTEMAESTDPVRSAELRRQLLAYCKLDTFAMVSIFQRIQAACT
ncbi:DUF2779 domain-containing protein [Qipengyuania sp. GH25]|uniref:DUF2779 domain-containing protein n=1 Tax=Qipengyuania pacifica TaxID=2860199 RepID=A0ABS7JK51_9SPHN|nr:DUF2779 domain-containing protein [Qipengyuania aerophila]MBX7489766.1 DUF2779 domain-containing protein [Qipengyuania aerophila]